MTSISQRSCLNSSFRLTAAAASVLLVGCSASERAPQVERFASTPLSPGLRAFDTEWGIIISPDADTASTFADELRSAAASFYTSFGVRVPPGCMRVVKASTAAGCRSNAPWTMDWPSLIIAERKDPGQSYWRLVGFGFLHDSSANRSAFALGEKSACEASYQPVAQAGMLRHELLHQFYIRLLWPNDRGPRQYGGGAPDWLDEAAAISGEPPYLVRSRRARFVKMLQTGKVIPLPRFLTMEHPVMPAIRAKPIVYTKGHTTILVEHESPNFGEGARLLDFYAEVRAFSDFLAASSRNTRILRSITDQLKTKSQTVRVGATTLEAPDLQVHFLRWVRGQGWGSDDAICAA